VKQAVEFLSRGDARSALHAASEACHEAPLLAEAHYVYGQAWLALGDPAHADQAFATSVQLKPDWPDAWVNYGLARYQQGAVPDAKTAMRQALRYAPGHRAATANLGALLNLTGDTDGAEALLREAIARDPLNAGARLNLAADLLPEERSAEALSLLEAAEPPADDVNAARHWHLQQALALLQLRRPADARAALGTLEALGPLPPQVEPLWLWRQVLLAMLEDDPDRARDQATRMERALQTMGPTATAEHRIVAHYDLAKFWSGQGQHPRAFSHWVSGHQLLARSQPFSRAEHLAFVDANIAQLDRARFAAGPRARNDDSVPIFIVGMPRSGTTLCEQILAAHAEVHGAGERPELGEAFDALGRGTDGQAVQRIAGLDAGALDAAAGRYLARLKALAPDKTRVADKMPGNFNYLGLVGLMLPGARIIHCARDPRDIGLSIFTFRFYGLHGYAHDLGDLGWYIGQCIRLMGHWKAALPNPILTIELSDWVRDFDGTLSRTLAHIGLPPDPNCARFYEAESRVRTASRFQVRQPINDRGLGRWKTHADGLAPLIEELARARCLVDREPR
jgi:Tfp pilus assembly protein PilF